MGEWLYKSKRFNGDIGDYVGFVYVIHNNVDGRSYVGKKLFSRAKTARPRKGQKRKRRSRVESDWRSYHGSSKELQNDVSLFGVENFTREILHLCKSKGECSYLELREQMLRDVLLKPHMYYNSYVGARINRAHLRGMVA